MFGVSCLEKRASPDLTAHGNFLPSGAAFIQRLVASRRTGQMDRRGRRSKPFLSQLTLLPKPTVPLDRCLKVNLHETILVDGGRH